MTALHDFIASHRDDLIRRCHTKMVETWVLLPTDIETDYAVATFLDQLCEELRDGPSKAAEIRQGAGNQGRAMLVRGLPIEQVVHAYGNICQSVSDLAIDLAVAISVDDFRTLNRCLDDAIASAVSAYSQRRDVGRFGTSQHLQQLVDTAITACEVLRSGSVGIGGRTGAVILENLKAIRGALVDQQLTDQADKMVQDSALMSTPST